jgi:hypothetical protein
MLRLTGGEAAVTIHANHWDIALQADIVFENGPVFRGLRSGVGRALALAGGKVVGLDDVAHLIGPGTRRVDLNGRLAIPPSTRRTCTCWPTGSASRR